MEDHNEMAQMVLVILYGIWIY